MILIVDGHSLAYKIFYKTPTLYNSKKIPTSLIHSFLNTILTLKEKFSPDELIVVFDSKGKTERHDMMEEYKANRQETPGDLITQVELLKKILPAMDVKLYAKEGIEADDIIYTLAERYKDQDVYIVTKDKDIAQLVSERVKILDYATEEILGRSEVIKKYQLKPEQIADFLALCGDTSDNIPGVKGIGEKTATMLLQEFGTLDEIYTHLEKIKPSIASKLEIGRNDAYLSRSLATLRLIDNIDSMEIKSDMDLKSILSELELKAVMKRLFSEKEAPLRFASVKEPVLIFFVDGKSYATDGNHIEEIDNNYSKQPRYVFNLKGLIKNRFNFEDCLDLEILSWLSEPDNGVIKYSTTDTIESFVRKLLSQKDEVLERIDKYEMWDLYWNVEYRLIKILAEMELSGIKLDPVKLKETDQKIRKLIGEEKAFIDKLLGEEININSPKQLSFILFEKLRLTPFKKKKTGFSTDEDSLRNMIALNPAYETLLRALLRYREYSKLVSTYTSKLSEYIDPVTKRVHTQFNQTGTATGRLSSLNPNLQNIPQKGEHGSEIRSAFVSEDGYSFLSFDYSQIELRVLADISDDDALKNAFYNDLDIHNITAMAILGVSEDRITKDIRRIAKAVNFGIIYGLSPYGLSRDVGISQSDAKVFIEKYFKTYPKVKHYMDKIVESAKKKGYVSTILGRKRFIDNLNSSNSVLRQRAERMAINSPIQGSAADIIKLAMIKSTDYLKEKNIDGRLILQVHDELVFEINDKEIKKVYQGIKEIMENVIHLKVPVRTSYSISKNLGDLK